MHTKLDPRALRNHLGLNQQQFWARLGVTQSGGSRYENERRIPTPTATLLRLTYEHGLDIERIDATTAPLLRLILSGQLDASTLQQLSAAAEHLRDHAAALAHGAASLGQQLSALDGRKAA